MQKQDIVMLIMNCEKYRYKAQIQREGWLKLITSNILYFHVIGNEELETDYIFDHENRILYVKTKDCYNSLPQKVISAFEAIHKTYEYKYIFKTDDDQELTQPIFLKLLIDFLKVNPTNYGGKIVNVIADHVSTYYTFHPELPNNIIVKKSQYCNGRFYVLSNAAITDLLPKKELFKTEYFEDYAVGYHLSAELRHPITPLPNDLFIDYKETV